MMPKEDEDNKGSGWGVRHTFVLLGKAIFKNVCPNFGVKRAFRILPTL